jgi:hypothetical protein
LRQLADQLDIEEGRVYMDDEQIVQALSDHYDRMVKLDDQLSQQIQQLQPVAEGVAFGTMQLTPENALDVIDWKTLLVRRQQVRAAQRICWGASVPAGSAPPPGQLLG